MVLEMVGIMFWASIWWLELQSDDIESASVTDHFKSFGQLTSTDKLTSIVRPSLVHFYINWPGKECTSLLSFF